MKPNHLRALSSIALTPLYLTLASGILLVAASPAAAGWSPYGVTAASPPDNTGNVVAAPDGMGGIVMAWDVNVGGVQNDVGIQRIDNEGNRLWGDQGIAVASFSLDQYGPALSADAMGNSFVVWSDARAPSGLRVQKLAPNGSLLWNANGALVVGLGTATADPAVLADEGGGCFIVWADYRTGNYDIYIQRFNSDGSTFYAANGLLFFGDPQFQLAPTMMRDGAGGVIVAWQDFRTGSNWDIYAQSFNFFGNPVWGATGAAVANSADAEQLPQLVTDGAAGAIVVYVRQDDIAANRVSASGSRLWGTNGYYLSNALNAQGGPSAVSDGAGGAIAAWTDSRDPANTDIYAQRIGGNGGRLWTVDGARVVSAPDDQFVPRIAPLGDGSVVITWMDNRPVPYATHLYAQRLSLNGVPLWSTDGRAFIAAEGARSNIAAFPDGNGNVIAAELDHGIGSKPVAQRIDGRHGYWGRPEPLIGSVADAPGDQGGHVLLNWLASGRDQLGESLITYYSVWRATDAVPAMVDGEKPMMVSLEEVGRGFEGPAFRRAEQAVPRTRDDGSQAMATGQFFWEYIGEQQALRAPGYSFSAPTRSDSTGGDPARHYFQVVSHTSNQYTYWPSLPDSGSSVDNIAPAAPLMLSAQRLGGDHVLLDWSPGALEGDLADYAVYRAGASGVTPDPPLFLANASDTSVVDSTATATAPFYYIVTARDIHDNESGPSNEAMVNGSPTGIGDRTPALTSLRVLPNVPNPFSAATTLRFELPEASDVTFEVFDVRGRRVRGGSAGRMQAGLQSLVFDGHDQDGLALPSGVYFFRVSAGGVAETRKLVISR